MLVTQKKKIMENILSIAMVSTCILWLVSMYVAWGRIHCRLKCLGEWFLAVNHHNHKNWDPSILTHNLWQISMWMKQKFFFFWKTKFKMADSKKCVFQNHQFSIFFVKISWIGPKVSRIDSCERHWFGSTYVGQPHGHIVWATSIPFASINSTNPRTNP